jgi:hypothetical protein
MSHGLRGTGVRAVRRTGGSSRSAARKRWGAAAITLLITAVSLAGPAWGAVGTTTSFGTYRFWNKTSGIGCFDATSGAQTMGQTFTAPADGALSKFIFWVEAEPTVKFRGYVYRWDPVAQHATGSALWSGGVRHTKDFVSYEPIVSLPQSVPVTSGSTYVIFLSSLGIAQRGSCGAVGAENRDGQCDFYSGGVGVLDDGATSPSEWTTNKWDYGDGLCPSPNGQPNGDLTFRVFFTS